MKSISQRLSVLQKEDGDAFNDVMSKFQKGKLSKGENLVNIGDVCKNVYVMRQGLARHYRYDEEGREYNSWFSFEEQIVLPVGSFINKKPSTQGVQLLEDSTFDYLSFNHLMQLLKRHHSIETLFRELLLNYYIEMEDRIHVIQAYSAEKKYKYLLAERPYILERISQNHVASYLGISRETLSRIRAKSRKS